MVKFLMHSPQGEPGSSKHMVSTARLVAMFGWENITRIDVYFFNTHVMCSAGISAAAGRKIHASTIILTF